VAPVQSKRKALLGANQVSLPNTFSRRKREAKGSLDPFTYSNIPIKVRNQILQIFDEAIAIAEKSQESAYQSMSDFMRKELGVERLAVAYYRHEEFCKWFRSCSDTDSVVDAVELVCRMISIYKEQASYVNSRESLKECITEINDRLFEASLGFQYESGDIIQTDSKFLHTEAVLPAIHLLADAAFKSANDEFMSAHKAFREADYDGAIVECCKALESTLKVIAADRKWAGYETAPLKKLLQLAFDNELIPRFLESEFSGLRSILESGVGTVRNKAGGHGAGEKSSPATRHLAAFQLHQTAAAIVLLVEASSLP